VIDRAALLRMAERIPVSCEFPAVTSAHRPLI
jgi:hypothetical protein